MAAVTIPVQPPPAYVAHAPTAATFRRRRLTALLATVVIAIAITIVAVRAAAAFGALPASRPERRPDPPATVVARPGDTLWSIARHLQPEGDVRPLVDALVRANGGATLDVGDRVVVP
jgi:Tfp pilus assembly protein FimV